MKNFVVLLAVVIIAMAVWKLWEYYNPSTPGTGDSDPGLTQALPPPLAPEREREVNEVKKRGPAAFKMLLERYKTSQLVKDPALAWLELDYVVMISQRDPVQAKKIFSEVKSRTPADSPVYPRVKELETTYE